MNAPRYDRPILEAEHESFRSTVRSFIEKEVTPFHDQWEKDGIVPRDLWTKAGAQGLLCFDVAEEYGGPGVADFRYNMVMAEELTRAGVNGPGFLVHTDIIVPYLSSLGTAEQKQRWLPGCVRGETITAISPTRTARCWLPAARTAREFPDTNRGVTAQVLPFWRASRGPCGGSTQPSAPGSSPSSSTAARATRGAWCSSAAPSWNRWARCSKRSGRPAWQTQFQKFKNMGHHHVELVGI